MQEWYPLKGYEGLYEITNNGRIRSIPSELKQTTDAYGYKVVQLIDKEGNKKIVKVHRMVANTFLENPLEKPFVDHINTKRDDNRVENLRWATPKENSNNPTTLNNLRKWQR